MKIVFMGTPDFAASVLKKLHDAGHDIALVLTQPDRAKSRGKLIFPPVKELALELGLNVMQPEKLEKSPETIEAVKAAEPDVIIVAAFGQILKKDVLDIPKLGCFNVHASLLPKLRGASPMQGAILEGLEYTGVTIMKMSEGLDTGDMVSSVRVAVGRKTLPELEEDLAEAGADLLVKTLPEIESGRAVFTKQDDSQSSYAHMISKKDGETDFNRSASEIERMVRAFQPWPGVSFEYNGKKIKIWAADVTPDGSDKAPGTVISADKAGILVKCGEDALLIKELQLPGKKRVSAHDFLLGNKVEPGAVFS
ncbi:MAG: methionyl-tRNA formyltransferase [Anaerovoracaceae bacterium]